MNLRTFQDSPRFANLAQHAGWAAFFVVLAHLAGLPLWLIVLGGIALAAFKEFYLDHKGEIPAQSYADGAQDFEGYAIGIVIGALAIVWPREVALLFAVIIIAVFVALLIPALRSKS